VRLAAPIPFESPDGQPVKLLFFLLIPDNVTQQHLEILSEIAEMFSDDAFRNELTVEPDLPWCMRASPTGRPRWKNRLSRHNQAASRRQAHPIL
jgi:hypothetical protein